MPFNRVNFLLLLFLFFCIGGFPQVSLMTWNIQNFGDSKSDAQIALIANIVDDYDIIAIQEIVAGPGGANAVARLADKLNRGKVKWDHILSNPTSGNHTKERYAFFWKTSKVRKVGRPWLEEKFGLLIEREPYLCTFTSQGHTFTLVNFHAVPKKMQPETEIKYFKYLPGIYTDLNLIFLGDFNCKPTHSVFVPIQKLGYLPALTQQKTTLKTKCIEQDCLASEYDNIWFNCKSATLKNSGIIHFYKYFTTLKEARKISDHVPVFATLNFLI